MHKRIHAYTHACTSVWHVHVGLCVVICNSIRVVYAIGYVSVCTLYIRLYKHVCICVCGERVSEVHHCLVAVTLHVT